MYIFIISHLVALIKTLVETQDFLIDNLKPIEEPRVSNQTAPPMSAPGCESLKGNEGGGRDFNAFESKRLPKILLLNAEAPLFVNVE